MKFTSLTTIIVSAAAMAGVATALNLTPQGLPVVHRFCAVLNRPARFQQRERLRLLLRTQGDNYIIHAVFLQKLL
ncbi:hypothetical protein BDR03DRAFT_955917 [Suillus americanus]|nr:hypothetical protein BDR03DRAFT_955917 [Suillus americanus]